MGYRFGCYVGIYLALFFGWRPSPANWGVISTLVMQHVAAHRPAHPKRDGPEGFIAYQYVDDGAFVEPWVGLRPWLSPSLWERAMSEGIGLGAVHAVKRAVDGCAATRSILWCVEICAESGSFTLPPAKALRAQQFIAAAEFDPAMTRIPLKRIQEIRGKLEHRSICNRALSTELRHIDRLLVVREGVVSPKGSLRKLKQAYVDFWDSLGTIRVHLLTGDSLSQSYTTAYSNVLSLEELLSFPESRERLVWLGADATPITVLSGRLYPPVVRNLFIFLLSSIYVKDNRPPTGGFYADRFR